MPTFCYSSPRFQGEIKLLRRGWDKLLSGVYSVEEVIALLNGEWGFTTRQTKKRGGAPLTRSHGYKNFSSVFYAAMWFERARCSGECTSR